MQVQQRVTTRHGYVSADDVRKKTKINVPLSSVCLEDENFITIEFATINLFKNVFDGDKQLNTRIKLSKDELAKYFPHTKQLSLLD